MNLSEQWQARGGLLVVFGLGGGPLLSHITHAMGERESVRTFVLGILVPMLFAVGLLVGGAWLRRADLQGEHVLLVAGWCFVGCGVLTAVGVLTVLYQQAEGVMMSDPFYVVANAGSLGGVVGFLVGWYDVRQRLARTRAERLSRQATVVNRVLRHDIRNSANVIVSRADFLSDASANGEQAHAEKIQQQAMELVELGDYARDIEQLLHGAQEREVVNIVPVVETHLDRLERDYPAVDVWASLPPEREVHAHPLVTSAIANTLDNAVEHNDEDVPRVVVSCSDPPETGADLVEVTVADNGPGIPEKELDVLDRGYETPLDHTGGLGLWLIRWILEESGGDVEFEVTASEGSRVHLRFEPATSPRSRESESARDRVVQ